MAGARVLRAVLAVLMVAAGMVAFPTGGAADIGEAGMFAALRRDLGLGEPAARDLLARQVRASATEAIVASTLGSSYAGSWLKPGTGDLVVALTDPAGSGVVTAAGAEPLVVARSLAELDAIKSTLDRNGARAPLSVPGWRVEVTSNSVVVLVQPGAQPAARDFLASAGVGTDQVRLVESSQLPVPLYDVRGADAYYIGKARCSIGFSVRGGHVTAGHCGKLGPTTTGYNREEQGTFRGVVFPGDGDYSWVEVNANWTPQGVVNDYRGGTIGVAGSQESAVGAAICRSGNTTGWHCGMVLGKNETVRYPQGAVTGMTRTNVCGEPGDSGGPWLTDRQAQGLTSGGSGSCSTGGTTFFQPVNEVLSAFGLTLLTGDSTPPNCATMPVWNASSAYKPGNLVTHKAHRWEAIWWSAGAEPGDPKSWAVWKDAGSC